MIVQELTGDDMLPRSWLQGRASSAVERDTERDDAVSLFVSPISDVLSENPKTRRLLSILMFVLFRKYMVAWYIVYKTAEHFYLHAVLFTYLTRGAEPERGRMWS